MPNETFWNKNHLFHLFAYVVGAYLDTCIAASSIQMNNHWQLIRFVVLSQNILRYSFEHSEDVGPSWSCCTSFVRFGANATATRDMFRLVHIVRSICHFLSSFSPFPLAQNTRNRIFGNILASSARSTMKRARTHSKSCSSHESRDNGVVFMWNGNAQNSTLRTNMKFCSKSYTLVELKYNVRTELLWCGIVSAHTYSHHSFAVFTYHNEPHHGRTERDVERILK